MPAIEKGDTPYVSTNLAELGSEKLSKNGGGRPSDGESNPKTDNGGNIEDNKNE